MMKTYARTSLFHAVCFLSQLIEYGSAQSVFNGRPRVQRNDMKRTCVLPQDYCDGGFSPAPAMRCSFGTDPQHGDDLAIIACPGWFRQWRQYPYRFDFLSEEPGLLTEGVFVQSKCTKKVGVDSTFPGISAAVIRSPSYFSALSQCHVYRLGFWLKLASQPVLSTSTETKYVLEVYLESPAVAPPGQPIWGNAADYSQLQEGVWIHSTTNFTVNSANFVLNVLAFHPNQCSGTIYPISIDEISLDEGVQCIPSSTTTTTSTPTTTTPTTTSTTNRTTKPSTVSSEPDPPSVGSTTTVTSTTSSTTIGPPTPYPEECGPGLTCTDPSTTTSDTMRSDITTTETPTTTTTGTTTTMTLYPDDPCGPGTTCADPTTPATTTTSSAPTSATTTTTGTTSTTAPRFLCGDGGSYDAAEDRCRCLEGFTQDGPRQQCRCPLSLYYNTQAKNCHEAPVLLYSTMEFNCNYTPDLSDRNSAAFQRFATVLRETLRDALRRDLVGNVQNGASGQEFEAEILMLRAGSVVADVILRIETEAAERQRLIVGSWQRLKLGRFEINGVPIPVTSEVNGFADRCQNIEGAAVRCGSGAYCKSSSTNETTSCECHSGLVKLHHSSSCGPPPYGPSTEVIIAIVGGVVGGLVLIAFITLFALKRRVSRRPPPEPRRNSRATVASQSSRPMSQFQDARSRNRSQISSNYALTVYPASNVSRGRPPVEEQPDNDDEAESSATSGYPESNRSLSFSSTY